jgi:hypothetical protein
MRKLLFTVGWILVLGSVGVLARALFLESSLQAALGAAAVGAGVLLALAGNVFTQAKSISDAEEKRSLFNLDGFRLAFEHALSLLSDGNNDRATWIEAARSLAHGVELAKAVTVAEHRRVLDLERLKYRGSFHGILAGKSADFFYGVPPLYATLDEAAAASSRRPESNGRRVVASANELEEASVRAVWSAVAWPKDYADPLGERFHDSEVHQISFLFPELHRFLEHRRTWASVNGQLSRRNE